MFESLREGVYCADKKDVITLTNRKGGLLFTVRFPFLGQSWDFCQLGDSAGRFVTLDKYWTVYSARTFQNNGGKEKKSYNLRKTIKIREIENIINNL
ncbi:hypothetical protein Bpfe_020389 [Biomphalaria pfeifferi]|uniref:Uncharacterized protein n=1 Tax=Biomphalaria pfeifferi TaxID=112525 RepID=A0AAD8B926_BIOPF|nr:hypothetical protein Bpfe_020389 [Biomphalaria pfeifferi]